MTQKGWGTGDLDDGGRRHSSTPSPDSAGRGRLPRGVGIFAFEQSPLLFGRLDRQATRAVSGHGAGHKRCVGQPSSATLTRSRARPLSGWDRDLDP